MPPFKFGLKTKFIFCFNEDRIFRISPDSSCNIASMSYKEASRAVEDHITTIFKLHPNEKLVYHNIDHTRKVVQHVNEIALFFKLNDEQLFIVEASAWFHDIGYLFTGPKEHELESVHTMKRFIPGIISTPALAEKIEQCIMATKRASDPVSVSEKIICDADTYHFGTFEFKRTDSLIKKEIELMTGSVPAEWISHSIKMLKNHRFYTSYCQERLETGKMENIAWLQSLL